MVKRVWRKGRKGKKEWTEGKSFTRGPSTLFRHRPSYECRHTDPSCLLFLRNPQAHVKRLNPARFQGSWKAMLQTRPRVRTNGFYFLLSSYIKKPIKVSGEVDA